jgi:ATP-dependent Lon protease
MSSYRLPLFPLNVVLFPGTPLPLHIFEPRYRQLLKDCLAGERKFGLLPPGAQRDAPDAGAVGCVAEIRANEQLPDGRSNVLVLGGPRFVLERLIEDPAPYHVGMVREFQEQGGTLPAPDALHDLRAQFLHYYRTLRLLNDTEPDEPGLPEHPVPFSFTVAAAVECDLGLKQRLLATRSTRDRVEVLLRLLPTLSATAEAALRVHRRAQRNGKGSAQSVLPPSL